MASQEDKKKILDIRLNEGNSVHALKTMQQEKSQSDQVHKSPEAPVSSVKESGKDSERETAEGQPQYISATKALEPEETAVSFSEKASAEKTEAGSDETENDEMEIEDTRSKPRRILDKVLLKLGGVIPKRGDPLLEIVRKCVFLVALITLIASLSYIFNDLVISPVTNEIGNDKIATLYNPDDPVDPPADFTDYPNGILPAFKALYAVNQDLRGYIRFADTNKNWLNVDLPVAQTKDNEYYLTHDFQKTKNQNGCLFFDYRDKIDSPSSSNKALIVYGHDMSSGQMFGSFYHFIQNINYARTAPVIDLDTIYQEGQYKVFAVMVINNNPDDGQKFDYLRTDFNGKKDFMDFVANVRARSLYTYKDVTVSPDDQLLILSTCSRESMVHFKDGRVVVVARKVRSGETAAIDSSNILTNDNVIMPEAWYKNQGKPDHPYYSGEYTIPDLWTDNSDTTEAYNNTTAQPSTAQGTTAGTTTKKTTTKATAKNTTSSADSSSGQIVGTQPTETQPPAQTTQATTKEPEATTNVSTAAPTEKPPENSSQSAG